MAGKPFLRAAKPDAVRLHPVVSTNRVLLGADADPERGVAIAFAALDNLVKGAAGQAVQNANLMLGLEETTGLLNLTWERTMTHVRREELHRSDRVPLRRRRRRASSRPGRRAATSR